MKSSALLAPGLFRPDWTDADAPKCLSQSSFVFVGTDTSVALPVHPRPLHFPSSSSLSSRIVFFHPPPQPDLTFVSWFFYLDFLLAWHEPRSVPSAFRRTCAELSGCARTKEILEQIGSPRGQTEKGARTREAYVPRSVRSQKQETNKRAK